MMPQDLPVFARWFPEQLQIVFAGDPWYGRGIMESLKAIPEAHWQRKHAHQSIANLLGHMIAWRRFLVEKLRNNDAYAIKYQSPEEWPDVSQHSSAELLAQLEENQQALLAELAQMSPEALAETIPVTYKYTKLDLVNGILQHDLYHLGQINLIATIFRDATSPTRP